MNIRIIKIKNFIDTPNKLIDLQLSTYQSAAEIMQIMKYANGASIDFNCIRFESMKAIDSIGNIWKINNISDKLILSFAKFLDLLPTIELVIVSDRDEINWLFNKRLGKNMNYIPLLLQIRSEPKNIYSFYKEFTCNRREESLSKFVENSFSNLFHNRVFIDDLIKY